VVGVDERTFSKGHGAVVGDAIAIDGKNDVVLLQDALCLGHRFNVIDEHSRLWLHHEHGGKKAQQLMQIGSGERERERDCTTSRVIL
jgi:hypothetical protein